MNKEKNNECTAGLFAFLTDGNCAKVAVILCYVSVLYSFDKLSWLF